MVVSPSLGLAGMERGLPPEILAALMPLATNYHKEYLMLVLSRRVNETLLINDNIRFTVLGVSGNQVRIGIEAPADVIVLREEIVGKPNRNGHDEVATESSAPINNADHHGKVGRYGLLGLRRRRQ